MRILFDKNISAQLSRYLRGHSVQLSAQLGWGTLENGDLLRNAEVRGFDVMVTADQNIKYQQNLKERLIALVVLGSNRWPFLKNYLPEIIASVDAASPSSYAFIEIPLPPKPPYDPQTRD